MHFLIIDDEKNIRKTTAMLIKSMGHEAAEAENGPSARKQLESTPFDVALLDLKLDDENGLDLLPKLLQIRPTLDVIVFTAYGSIETAVEAMRLGAADYVPKPFTPEQLRQILAKITRRRRLEGKVADLESRLSSDTPSCDLHTDESGLRQVYEVAFKAAASPATILLTGESGTGKNVLARAIHDQSQVRDNPFVVVSCPSLSRELLESELFGHVKGAFTGAIQDTWGKAAAADGGTLFLDEIGELPLEIQPKLLRLLQEREYERVGEAKTRRANVRVIAATNRDLEGAVKQGRFREDLLYRLNVISIPLPPLRQRLSDLARIANGYLKFFASQCGKTLTGFSPAAQEGMLRYPWPGNLRELRNFVERAAILASGPLIELSDLPDKLTNSPSQQTVQVGLKVSIDQLEQEHIRMIINQTKTLEEAAHVLGIDPATLYRKRKRMGEVHATNNNHAASNGNPAPNAHSAPSAAPHQPSQPTPARYVPA